MTEQTMPKENKMGTMPVGKLLVSMSLPIMLSMLIQALYNIVDSMYVSQINENALTAVSLAFPVQNLMIGFAVGTGVGVGALLSRYLGAKQFDRVNRTATAGILLALITMVVFAILGGTLSSFFFRTQTQDPQILEYGIEYLSVVTVFSVGLFLQIMYERLLQSTGRTLYTMFTQGLGAIINIVLDPVLIFGYFGLPAMGVTGAAVATVIGQVIAMIVSIFINHHKNPEIHISFRKFMPDWQIIKEIYAIGIPSILMNTIGSVMTFCMNKILIAFTTTATAVFGVYFKLQSFVFMPVFGLNSGMTPILSYNYGARNKKRIFDTLKLGTLFAISLMLLGFAAFQLFPAQLLGIFNASPDMLSIGIVALRTVSYSYLFAGFCIICSTAFQALNHSIYSLFIAIARQLVVLIPAAYLLSLTGRLELVWLSFPIAEIMSVTVSGILMVKVIKKLKEL